MGGKVPLDANPLDILTLPPIVAGPVLRRLTRTQVSVWVALARSGDITLAVRVAGQPATEVASAPITPVQVGSNLWMATVTVDAPGGTFGATTLYEYRLMSPAWPQPNWADFAIGTSQPAFPGPPATIDQLAVLHTSCRKVHGGSRDGLAVAATGVGRGFGGRHVLRAVRLLGQRDVPDDPHPA